MYEQRGGRLRLPGAEFIVPVAAWHKHRAAPPVLVGQSCRATGSRRIRTEAHA